MNAIFQLLQLCGETRKFSGFDGCVLHLIFPGCLSECPLTIPMHTSEYLIAKNLNVYFHQDFYAGESEKSRFVICVLCNFGLISTNLDTPLNTHYKNSRYSKAEFIFSSD